MAADAVPWRSASVKSAPFSLACRKPAAKRSPAPVVSMTWTSGGRADVMAGLEWGKVLHFGTHGALEFMPGKQAGMSGKCWPDRLIGDIPNFYLYAANNPSEGMLAKRRSGATLISYLTPPLAQAGLGQGRTLLGFAGSPWTIATYMVNGEGSRDQHDTRAMAASKSGRSPATSSLSPSYP